MDISQLVQDVIDGKESTEKALKILDTELDFLHKCIRKVAEIRIKDYERDAILSGNLTDLENQ